MRSPLLPGPWLFPAVTLCTGLRAHAHPGHDHPPHEIDEFEIESLMSALPDALTGGGYLALMVAAGALALIIGRCMHGASSKPETLPL